MISIFVGVLGLALGSFVNALVWRLREQEGDLRAESLDLRKGKKIKAKKREKAQSARELSILRGRSMCVHCKHTLAWFDLIPVISWLQLGGKCRYCKKKISWQYPLVEIVLAVLLLGSYLFWPLPLATLEEYILFLLWVPILTILVALAVYDIRWMELPTKLIYALSAATGIFLLAQQVSGTIFIPVLDALIGSFVFGGLFWVLYQASDGKWIGGGDVRYGFAAGLLLGWQQSLLALMIASYLGLVFVATLAVQKKYSRKMRIPFGPFLIAGTYLAFLWGGVVVEWYRQIAGF